MVEELHGVDRHVGRYVGGVAQEPAVDLDRVAADDLARVTQGQLEGELGLAGPGGADDGEPAQRPRRWTLWRVVSCASWTVALR